LKMRLDQVCVKTGVLCSRCQSIVDNGEVSELDVNIMRELLEVENEIKELRDSSYYGSVVVGNLLILIVGSGQKMDMQKWIRVAKRLQSKFDYKIRIVEKSDNIKATASQLLSPARLVGVNIVWFPDGSNEYVIRLGKQDLRILPIDLKNLEEVLSKIHKVQVRVKVE